MVQGWGGGFQMLLLLSIGFTPLVNGSLDVPWQTTFPRQSRGVAQARRQRLAPVGVRGELALVSLGMSRSDVPGAALLRPAGPHRARRGCGHSGRTDLRSQRFSGHRAVAEGQGGEGACLGPASCRLISQPPSPSLPSQPAAGRASEPQLERSVPETEWVQWFKRSELDSCQWKGN